MTIASFLLVLLTTIPSAEASAEPVLLDFHAAYCGPCRQMRPAIELLSRKGYPIRSIDIERDPELAEQYGVQAVPTFIVADAAGREIDRTSGSQPAAQLARFYIQAREKARPPARSPTRDSAAESDSEPPPDGNSLAANTRDAASSPGDLPETDDQTEDQPFANPKPWETVVRIRVLSKGAVGFGSGTVIHSTPNESLILTCAHIFKLDGQRPVPPDRFPRKIMVDLFDGKLHGQRPAQVHFVESVEGKAVDYDFSIDVGLIRIRPGRRLPAARVVPAHWQPAARMKMLTVGCSEGNDATAWHTLIVNPKMRGLAGNPSYEAIECMIAPKQGRSGGGLFTTDGYVAGVCNFAEPRGNHGLYATPQSIYSLLDRNRLTALYAPVTRGSAGLLADGRARRRSSEGGVILRGQSPDREDSERFASARADLTIPEPELLGITPPQPAQRVSQAASGSSSTRRMAWHPTPARPSVSEGGGRLVEAAEPTDLDLDPSADHDRFSSFDSTPSRERVEPNLEDISPPRSGRSRWRPSQNRSGSDAVAAER